MAKKGNGTTGAGPQYQQKAAMQDYNSNRQNSLAQQQQANAGKSMEAPNLYLNPGGNMQPQMSGMNAPPGYGGPQESGMTSGMDNMQSRMAGMGPQELENHKRYEMMGNGRNMQPPQRQTSMESAIGNMDPQELANNPKFQQEMQRRQMGNYGNRNNMQPPQRQTSMQKAIGNMDPQQLANNPKFQQQMQANLLRRR